MISIPRYWSRAEGQVDAGPRGTVSLRIWGWSATSMDEADALARHRLADLVTTGIDIGRRGQEYYPDVPVREEILQEIHDESGDLLAAVTRNRYGAEVLCTDAVLIADVDLPERRPVLRGLMDRLRGRSPKDPAEADLREIRDRVEAVAAAHPSWGVHLHRTFAGCRVLITGSGITPSDPRSEEVLGQLGSDPLYMRLCAVQDSYRARLTPKPWRLGTMGALPIAWPAEGHAADQRRTWVQSYDRERSGYATTSRLWWNGVEPSTQAERNVLALHDERCTPDAQQPLA